MPRREEYLLYGRLGGIEQRRTVAPGLVAFFADSASAVLDRHYFVAAADHESSFAWNEIDHEEPDANGHVYVSKGLYQIADSEAAEVGMAGANLLDAAQATTVFARLQEHRLGLIIRAAGLNMAALPRDVWAYLAVGHNEGMGTFARDGRGALGTIARWGLNWGNPAVPAASDEPRSYRYRNATRAIVKYGDDCITGGIHWPKEMP